MLFRRFTVLTALFTSLFLVMTIGTALVLPGCRDRDGSSSASAPHPPETVQRVYALHCLGCHGEKGEGTFGSNIQGLKTSVDEIARVIADGVGKMPGYRGHLTDQQMRELAEYCKTFK